MNILVVDDAKDIRLIIKSVLEKLGHTVTTAGDGEEAWTLLQDGQDFQIVISDWMMPRLDGLGLCERIRNEAFPNYIYIILLTGMSGRTNLISGIAAGADDFANKPINSEELEVRLRSAKRIMDLEQSLAQQNIELERANRKLQGIATTDSLTGLFNRRAFQARLEDNILFSRRTRQPLSLLLIDVDFFKSYNDTFGHIEGDTALQRVSKLLKSSSRGSDYVARFGGEEFAIILPNTDAQGANICAEEVRSAIESYQWPKRPLTISIGVATMTYNAEEDLEVSLVYTELLSEADQALYISKDTGRNKSSHFSTVLSAAKASN